MNSSLPSERAQQVHRLLDAVVHLTPGERRAYLDRACAGDTDLRREVEDSLEGLDRLGLQIGDAFEGGRRSPFPDEESYHGPPRHLPGRYRMHEKLGSGGMGVVYKAYDHKLERTVALKFLPPPVGRDDEAAARFLHEAKAASALEHPGICTVYDLDETDEGRLFIVMAYCDGESLKDRIARGPIETEEAVELLRRMAEGLQAAHEAGVVHRDIKPGNVMTTRGGGVKLVDFGLAKMRGIDLTRAGTRLGTVTYMSPEQARGDEVDHRTDIWSLGVVFYEMLAGVPPFRGEYEQAVIYSILHEEPPALDGYRPDISPKWQRVVTKMLQKDPARRYADVPSLLRDLTADAVVEPPAPAEKGVVVLPFEDISPGKDNAYFSDGLTEEIIADLSQVRALRVISRNSSMMLKGSPKDIRSIGRELDVQYVLEGSVRKAGNSLRITAQLIDATNDRHVWAEKYRGTMDDVFDIQEEVSRSIVDALKVRLSDAEKQRIEHRPIDNVQAYECHLKARHEILQFSEEALDRGLNYLQNGLNILEENPLLLAGMGYAHWQYVNAGIRPKEHLEMAEEYVERIFQLEPGSGHGHRIRGLIHVSRGDVSGAVEHLRKSLADDPNNPDALLWTTILYGCIGRTETAFPLAERLVKIDPLTPINHGLPGWLHFVEGRFDEAVADYRTMYEMEPQNPVHRFFYVQGLAYAGRTNEAVEVAEQLIEDTPEHPFAWMCAFFKHALEGNRDAALRSVTPELTAVAAEDMQYAWFMAVCHALVGEKASAIQWLDNAIERGFVHRSFFAESDPFLANLRGDDSFEALMEKASYAMDHLEV